MLNSQISICLILISVVSQLLGIQQPDLSKSYKESNPTQILSSKQIDMAQQVHDDNIFTDIRLPRNVKPKNYQVTLEPNFKTLTFKGQVRIQYEANEPVDKIILHASELVISDGSVGEHKILKVTYCREAAVLEFDKPVPSNGVLELNFTGTLNDKMVGFYRTEIILKNGDLVYGATTKFEPTHARKALPCWDEPAIKATFDVTLIFNSWAETTAHQVENIGLSNMPVKSKVREHGDTIMSFETTPIMSTYLLAFIVGPFEYIEARDCYDKPVRVYTAPGKSDQGEFALEVACKSLAFFERYFNLKNPLPKMDLIAVPDFASGAMENWGLITYRETTLLVNPENPATQHKQRVAIVVSHEIAHQWFGNLVTMEWWTHLWLNEGFANFLEHLCVDHIFPEYQIWSQFVSDTYSSALNLDALDNSHPIEVPVKHPNEIMEVFDSISYDKGGSIIRMLYEYIGDKFFRKGMENYLSDHSYRNAITEDLWNALEIASEKPIRKMMSGWTSQKGFPWLSVNSELIEAGFKLTVKQSKFSADGKLKPEDADKIWIIPINISTEESSIGKIPSVYILDKKSGEFVIENLTKGWVKVNSGAIGFFRTSYSEEMLKPLIEAIKDQSLPAVDRFNLQSDYYALCQAGLANTGELLKMLEAFKAETSYNVWASIDRCLSHLSIILRDTEMAEKLRKFGCELYSGIYSKLMWNKQPGERHTDALTRAVVIGRLVTFGDIKVIDEAKRKFESYIAKIDTFAPDLRGAIYKAVASHSDEANFEYLFKLYRETKSDEERNTIARALGSTSDSGRLQRVIDFVMSDNVRPQDKVFPIVSMGMSNPSVAWKFLQDNKDEIRNKYKGGFLLTAIVNYCSRNFASEAKATEVEQFFKQNPFPAAERTINQSIETILLNAKWLSRDKSDIEAFLKSI